MPPPPIKRRVGLPSRSFSWRASSSSSSSLSCCSSGFSAQTAPRGERRPSRQRDESEKGAVGEPTWRSGEGFITQHRVAGVGIGIGVGVRVARLRGGVVEDVLASPKFKLFRQRQAFLLVPHLLALLLELPERRQRGIRDAGNDCDRCVAAPGTWLHGTR